MILLVDDNQELAKAFKIVLESRGFEVATVFSGEMALQYLTNQEMPELILLDYSMPEMSGEEFIEIAEKTFPDLLKRTKIVGLSSFSAQDPSIVRFKTKLSDFSEKPLDIRSFVGLVEKHLSKADR